MVGHSRRRWPTIEFFHLPNILADFNEKNTMADRRLAIVDDVGPPSSRHWHRVCKDTYPGESVTWFLRHPNLAVGPEWVGLIIGLHAHLPGTSTFTEI